MSVDEPNDDESKPDPAQPATPVAEPSELEGRCFDSTLPDATHSLRPDPWAHRRGEPRIFALLWIAYILLTIVGSLEWVARATSITADSYSPAARIMLIVLSVGALILWPMTRLCQAPPHKHVLSSVWADIFVVLGPSWMVIWSLVVTARWPMEIVAALAALFAAWLVLIGGVLAGAFSSRCARSSWMLLIVALVFVGVVLREAAALALLSREPPTWLGTTSPIAGVLALTGQGLSGPQDRVTWMQWFVIALTGVAALLFWSLAARMSIKHADPALKQAPRQALGQAPTHAQASNNPVLGVPTEP